MERARTCCFIGHRTLPRGIIRYLMPRITDGVSYLLDRDFRHFLLSGARGFDTACARTLLCMKLAGFDFNIHLTIPENSPSFDDNELYRELMKCATSVIYIEDTHIQSNIQHLINSSSACIAYVERANSDSAQSLCLAQKAGLTIYNLASEAKKHSDPD